VIRVFLVEDEIIIRNGIKNSIEWENEGYQFVGEASDGELALPIILKEKPDILITDIRMPFMSGLELSSLVKKELPDIKIIILSGYDDFDYAKDAIHIGVARYLLKPVSSAKLLENLKEVSEQILHEQKEKELKEEYLREMSENEELKKMKFFGELVSGNISLGDAIDKGKTFHMNLSAQIYKIILFKIQAPACQDSLSDSYIETYEEIGNTASGLPYIYSFQRGADGWAFLLIADEPEEMEYREKSFTKTLKDIVSKYPEIEYFGGIGKPVFRLRELNNSFHDADYAFASRFTKETNQICYSSDNHISQNIESLDCNNFAELEQAHNVIGKFLNNGTIEEVQSFVNACFNEIPEEQFHSTIMRQYIIMNIYISVKSFCEKILANAREHIDRKISEADDEAMKQAILTAESVDDIKIYIGHLLEQALEIRNTASGRGYSDIIKTAVEQIEHTYMSDNISLNTVAASVGMSPSYFSSIFSREMGRTFTEYLTDVRMEKAKELLTCSSMRTSEIGYKVGYKDPHYFSYIFKKMLGCSPKKYRSDRKGEDK
jgi:two-component system response regulator YesN